MTANESKMTVQSFKQGSPEWHKHRRTMDNASEAAAMLGLDKKTKRNELLDMYATGNKKAFSDYVQNVIFAKGHEVEALARPIVEAIIGDELYPVTGSRGGKSASFDGITLDDRILFEHKQWNEALAASVRAGCIPDSHMPQLQQGLMVSGGDKLIFVVSDGTEENMVYLWVYPDKKWFERINAGWEQFDTDRAVYVPPIIAPLPIAASIRELPVITYKMDGLELTSNLSNDVRPAVIALVELSQKPLVTDDDFTTLDALNKKFKLAETKCADMRERVLTEVADINAFCIDLNQISGMMRDARLVGERAFKKEIVNRKNAIFMAGERAYIEYVDELQAEIKDVKLVIEKPDFAAAGKGLKKLVSLQNAIDTCLANAKIAAHCVYIDWMKKLNWCVGEAAGRGSLLPDLQQLMQKPFTDFCNEIEMRIIKSDAAEAQRVDEMQIKIECEAQEKAALKFDARLESERVQIRTEEQEKAAEETKTGEFLSQSECDKLLNQDPKDGSVSATEDDAEPPTRKKMIMAISCGFQTDDATSENWLINEFGGTE